MLSSDYISPCATGNLVITNISRLYLHFQERQEDLKSAIQIASKIAPNDKTSKAIETLEKAKSDLLSHCGDLEDKLNYRLSIDFQQKDNSTMDGATPTEQGCKCRISLFFGIYNLILYSQTLTADAYVPGSFARKQISKLYPKKLAFTNRWEDSVSLFYSWLKKEEESVKEKQIPLGDIPAIKNAIKDAEVRQLWFNEDPGYTVFKFHLFRHRRKR